MTITVLTPSANRPVGLELAERMMDRQTRQPDQWLVVESGLWPTTLTSGQDHDFLHTDRVGVVNFTGNLLRALPQIAGDLVVMWEDDDWYAPTHLETIARHLEETPSVFLVGDNSQRYYHVGARCFRAWPSPMPSLCQMAFHSALLPTFEAAARTAIARQRFEVDQFFWRAVDGGHSLFAPDGTVVNIKGLPGQVGLGMGHRPTNQNLGWTADADLSTLRSWIGDDVEWYRALGEVAA